MATSNEEARQALGRTVTISKVGRSIGEWEAAENKSSNEAPKTKTGQIAAKVGTKKRLSLSQEKDANPTQTEDTPPQEKFKDKTAEARACLNKAKLHLNNSKNIKTEIKAGVVEAVDRLYKIVKDLEMEIKERHKGEVVEHTQPREPRAEPDHSLIVKQLDATSKLLQVNNVKIEELRIALERQSTEHSPQMYATVASKTVLKPQLEPTLHSVLISSEDADDTGEAVLNKIRDTIDAKEGWIRVERIRKARDRKIIMSVGSREERRKIMEKLQSSEKRLTCEKIHNKDPLLILFNVLSVHDDPGVLKALRNQNRQIFQNLDPTEYRVEIKYSKKARNPLTNHIIVRTSPVIWKRAMELGTLHIDLQKIRIEDQSPLVQCTRCLDFGHSKRFCKESVDSCSHCSGPHLRSECAEWVAGTEPSCRNCKNAKNESSEHNAFSGHCPIRKRWDWLARSAVAYC